jgi:hypothetical protein
MGYWNDISQKEVREVLANERDCFRTRAEADAALEASGRFKRQNETRITGASGAPTYPQQPAGAPWAQGDPGAPDPATNELGYSIDELEPILQPTSLPTEVSSFLPSAGASPLDAGPEPILPANESGIGSTKSNRRNFRRF